MFNKWLFFLVATHFINLNILNAAEEKNTFLDRDTFPKILLDTLNWHLNQKWILHLDPISSIPLFNPIDGFLLQTGLKTIFNQSIPFEIYIKPRYAIHRKMFYGEAEFSIYLQKNREKATQWLISGGNFLKQVNQPFIKNEQIISLINLLEGIHPLLFVEKKYINLSIKQSFESPINIAASSMLADRTYLENHRFQWSTFRPNEPLYSFPLKDKSFVNSLTINYGSTLSLHYKKGIAGMVKSQSDFDYLELAFSKLFHLKEKGRIDLNYITGIFFTRNFIHFNDFYHFPTGKTLKTSHPVVTTFRLLDYYQFSTNQYFHRMHLQVQVYEFLWSKLNFLKKQNISENLFINLAVTEKKQPFLELGYALDDILKKIRLEIVIGRYQGAWLGPRIILGPTSL
jgi:hypothetical protein